MTIRDKRENKMYKILIVHNQYQFTGGEDTVAENEGKLLSENGNEVLYYIRNNKEIDNYNKIRKILAGLGTFFSIKSYREISNIIRENGVDIVHIHNTVPLISLSAYYAAKKNKCKLVQSIHNQRMLCPSGLMERNGKVCEECVNYGLNRAIKHKCYKDSKLYSFLLAKSLELHKKIGTYNKVDAFLVTTEFNKYQLLRSGVVSKERIFMKPYYFDCDIRELNNKKRKYFLYIARLERVKGIFVLLEAIRGLREEKLLIRGNGPDEYAVKDYVRENSMQNVVFLDYLSKEQMLEYIYNAKAVIIPTQLYEGFPMTIVESFSMGTPVIGSNFGNVGTIIRDHENGLLFDYASSKDLACKISELSNNIELSEKLEKNAQDTFAKNHTAECVYRKTMEIYSKI